MAKRLLSVLMVLFLVIGFIPAVSAAATGAAPTFTDMPDDWSTAALESAVANGLIEGADGKIMPRDYLTRAQMATIIVRAFGAAVEGDISAYSDVRSTDWFAGSMAKAYQMGVMQGYDGKLMPDDNITREQAFAMLARGLKLQPADSMDKTFADTDEISDWAKGEVYALVNAGYVQGSDGKLNPRSNISRAEFAQVMYRLIKQYISQEGEETEVADGNVMINVPGVTLKGVTVTGDLIIGDGVGDGDVILDDVIVKGRLLIRGGGENSVIIRGASSMAKIVVARVDGVVRVFVEGDADVEVIYVVDGSDDVIVEGTVGSIELTADNVTVTATNATLTDANVTGDNSKIIVDEGSSIGTINISGENTTVSGAGDVGQVVVEQGGDGASIGTGNTQITVGAGVEDVTAGGGTPVAGGSTAINNPEGTDVVDEGQPPAGPVAPPYYPVSAISVDKKTTTLAVGATETLTVTFDPTNATNKNITWTSSDDEVATVGGGVVTGKKAGTATITAKSDNGKEATCTVTVVEEEVIAAEIDYAAVWNEARATWYIEVSVPEELLDIESITSISAIKEAGEKIEVPVDLIPDTDKVMWFGVAGVDGLVDDKVVGEYAYKVVRKDDSKSAYIFNFNYDPDSVIGVTTPNVINTKQNKGYDTIQAAITEATDGDTIQVYAGNYSTPIEITDKSLTILGEAGATLSGGLIASATAAGKTITISDLKFETYGLEVNGYDTVTINDNTFTSITSWTEAQLAGNVANAIYVHGSATGTATISGSAR